MEDLHHLLITHQSVLRAPVSPSIRLRGEFLKVNFGRHGGGNKLSRHWAAVVWFVEVLIPYIWLVTSWLSGSMSNYCVIL